MTIILSYQTIDNLELDTMTFLTEAKKIGHLCTNIQADKALNSISLLNKFIENKLPDL